MKIRSKLILNYSVLSTILLSLFSFIVVVFYIGYRHKDFDRRLYNSAVYTANAVLVRVHPDSLALRIVDRDILASMDDLHITICGPNRQIIYSGLSKPIRHSMSNLHRLRGRGTELLLVQNYRTVSIAQNKWGRNYVIKASAYDYTGAQELKRLLRIIGLVLGFSLLLIAGFGFYNALWSLKPFKKMIREIEEIEPSFMKRRVTVQGNDEVSHLALKFNNLLDRIEQAFETEQAFISNASHELRTPVTSVLGQIEVGLHKPRTEPEYKALLQSVYDDTQQMATIINGFLELAETNLPNDRIVMGPVRIDELIFSIIEHFEKRKPLYNVSVDFDSSPDTDTQLECLANERLLRLMFSNLIDNACKYSEDKKAHVMIGFAAGEVVISIADHGIGIPKEEITHIYLPLFRGSNTSGRPGHGIGLAIVKRIADLHRASLYIESEVNMGTTVIIRISNK